MSPKSPLNVPEVIASGDSFARLGPLFPWLMTIVVLLVLPLLFSSGGAITIMNQMAIMIVFALSYNMLLGQAGMLSFGHAVYMGLGGFFCMHIMNSVGDGGFPLPLPLLPLFGGLFGLIFAIIIGSFSTRSAGTVFAMITLGVGELVAACSIIFVAFFGGESGVSGDRTSMPEFLGIDFAQQSEVYYLIIFWAVLSAAAMFLFSRTPLGRVTNAVRDNEERAQFLGYSPSFVRYISFCLSGFFAGIAGALFAINLEILTVQNLGAQMSGMVLLVVFLGGPRYFIGPIIGAIIFTLLQTVLGLYTEIWQLYLGILFVATVMYFPGGLVGLFAMHNTVWKNGKLGQLAVPYLKMVLPIIIFVLSLAAVFELLFHARSSGSGDGHLSFFGLSLNSHSPVQIFVTLALAIAAAFVIRRMAPSVKKIWDEVSASAVSSPVSAENEGEPS